MGVISSDTLFHFSNSAAYLIDIIKEGFKPRFCLEPHNTTMLFSDKTTEEAMPMTCFCDLPLSNITTHLDFYGSYGIGLSKEWGRIKGLTPLTYIHENSTQINYLKNLATYISTLHHDEENPNKMPKQLLYPYGLLFEFTAFLKPYEGDIWRHDKYIKRRFYDEREWRFVPDLSNEKETYRLFKDDFLNEILRANANETISKKYRLTFSANDIKYLIVKTQNEMISLSDALDSMKTVFNDREIKILKTRIISSQQINEDF